MGHSSTNGSQPNGAERQRLIEVLEGMLGALRHGDEAIPTPASALETPVIPYRYLVRRSHPWRKQLYVMGRNMTVRQLVGTVLANQLTEEAAAADLDLPVEAIREALAYYEENAELLELESAFERSLLAHRRRPRGAQPVS